VTHPFHPLAGQDFEFVAYRQNWGEDRVHLHDENGQLFSLPAGAGSVSCVSVKLWATAHRFKRGHRIRVQVSSGSFPRYARNTGSGEPHATATRLLVADQSVYHDQARPSAIILPVRARD
jgi:predicted acyl esterase